MDETEFRALLKRFLKFRMAGGHRTEFPEQDQYHRLSEKQLEILMFEDWMFSDQKQLFFCFLEDDSEPAKYMHSKILEAWLARARFHKHCENENGAVFATPLSKN